MIKKTIFTIGYSGFTISNFIQELKKYNINVVIDVRSYAYSEKYPEYNKYTIKKILNEEGIYYKNYSKEFGARQEEKGLYSSNGYLDFDIFSKSEQFQMGVTKLVDSTEKGYRIVLMCAEKDPIQCHRAILVARAFYKLGFSVIHIMPNDISKDQKDIEKELLIKHFPDRNQVSLFNNQMSYDDYLNEAYKKQNEQIGYHLEEE